MTFELWCLFTATVLGLIHISADSFSLKRQAGNSYTVGARDQPVQRKGIAGRLHRANQNFLETYPLFATLVIVVHLSSNSGSVSYWGCILYLIGRFFYLPLYASGVPWLRTLSWLIATLGLVMVGVQVMV